MPGLMEKLVGDLQDKRRWREAEARIRALPGGYRTAAEGVERYLLRGGAIVRGDELVTVVDDLAAVFERAAAAGTPVRAVVGQDPQRFADDLLGRSAQAGRADREQQRLLDAIAEAEGGTEDGGARA